MVTMNLYQRPHIMYSVDEKGLKLTYKSDNQKRLAVYGSKTVNTDTHG
jgi:hypothetical protein